ncbi:MAG: hypothetical protein HS116_13050 [Planctomycetes bacterium]|nr:hypothetical protein [Planctomycetota bacterium]
MQSFCGIVYTIRDVDHRNAERIALRMFKAGAEAVCFATCECEKPPDIFGRAYHRRISPDHYFWSAVAECEWFAGGRACLIARADEEFDVDLWPLANRFADNDWKGCVVALAPYGKADVRVARKVNFSPAPNRWIERFETAPTPNDKLSRDDFLLTGVGIYDGRLWDVLSRMRDEKLEDDLSVPYAYLHDRSLDFLEINAGYKRD